MHPPDTEAEEAAHWQAFVQELSAHLAAQWPAMPERLGDRYPAFIEHGVQQALRRGLTRAVAIARYVNLWFVWGPAFHDKPGFEWALGLLAAPRERQWGTVHQLVQRSLAELQRLPEARIAAADLVAADQRLVEVFGALGVRGAMRPAEPVPVPLRACDLQAAELKLLAPAVTEHYAWIGSEWQRVETPLPDALRIDVARPLPRLIAALSTPPGEPSPARLQLKVRSHAICDGDRHPAIRFAGSHGLWQWQGHETKAVSWPVRTLEPPVPAAGPGTAIAEETSPDIFKLEIQSCGLRDEGDAIGSPQTLVWVWPAAQWWLDLQRAAPAMQPVQPGGEAVRGSTRCRLEAGGVAQDPDGLRRGFEQGLDPIVAASLQLLHAAWAKVAGLTMPRLEGGMALLVGHASATWGWRLGASGLDGRAFMRLVAELELQACQADLLFQGELELGGARSRLSLRCVASAPLRASLRRETAEPPLLPVMQAAVTRFRLPLEAELVSLAGDSGTVMQAAGPCTGALVGEAGLRPRTSGGSGWEWFAGLRLEPAVLPVAVLDPLLGRSQKMVPLLDALPLVDWRLG